MNNQPNHKNSSLQETPCPICGSQNFVWGRTVGESVSQNNSKFKIQNYQTLRINAVA